MNSLNYDPQLSGYKSSSSLSRKRRTVRILRAVIISLLVFIVATSSTLFYLLFSNGLSQPTNVTSPVVTEDSGVSPIQDPTTDPATDITPMPTVEPVEELLPENEIVESFFGPLPQPEMRTELRREVVRGIYIGTGGNLEQNIELANNSDINAFVVDLKESYGITYDSQNPLALEIGEVKNVFDLETLVQMCHDNDIWVIGRIVCFKDPGLALAHPEFSILDEEGNSLEFRLEGNSPFVNPYNTVAWDYYIDLAIEAIEAGVDEIQFDYVRFPTGSTVSGASPYFGPEELTPSKAAAINRFLQVARIRIQDTYGVPLSADVFGIILTSSVDSVILGQDWTTIGLTGIDNLCPMIYPSHYALGTILGGRTYDKPDFYPYEILYNVLSIGATSASQEGYSVVRPYLQAFTASYIGEGNYMSYGFNEINEQIRATYDAGYEEWILWSPNAVYPSGLYDGQ